MFFVSEGQAIEVACPGSLEWEKASNLSVGSSASGYTRASYFGGARVLRSMTVAHGVLSTDGQAMIDALTHLGFGADLGFVPTGAERANLLTPGASLLATVSGAMRRVKTVDSAGMVYAGGVNTPDTKRIATATPFVYGGRRVVLSAVGRGGAVCSIEWLNELGEIISYFGVTCMGESYNRATREGVAPANAVAFGVHIRGDIAAPAMTLEKVYPWQVGQVAKSVVIDAPTVKMLYAGDKTRAPFLGHAYTIREVGDYV